MKRIAVICAKWHNSIVRSAKISLRDTLTQNGVRDEEIEYFEVPGSLEIPIVAKWLADTDRYSVIVGCGFVVNGGIYRHEFVAVSVINAIVKVSCDSGVPIVSIILTPIDFDENDPTRERYFIRHMVKKGREGAEAVLDLISLRRQIEKLPAPTKPRPNHKKRALNNLR